MLRQFLVISSIVFLIGMGLVGNLLAKRIEQGVVDNTAAATALYFESFVAPLIQDLATSDTLSHSDKVQLRNLIHNTALSKRVLAFKVWLKGGRVAFSTDEAVIGKSFPPTPNMRRAWMGQVAATLDDHASKGSSHEGPHDVPVLEIYAPIRQEHSDRIIAVAEFYENAEELKLDIFRAQLESWALIAGLAAVTISALYGIVSRGASTISQQRLALQQRIEQLSSLLDQNDNLRKQVQDSSRKAADINESYLRRFGSELHDGPAQLLGLALLRLDSIGMPKAGETMPGEVLENGPLCQIREVLKEALEEIRNLSAGLSLPELEKVSLAATIGAAVRAHRHRSHTGVDLELSDNLPESVAHVIKGTAFRLVQEGLNNATRHAGGIGQRVRAFMDGNSIVIEVSDRGPGFVVDGKTNSRQLGLIGLRERIRALRGSLEVRSCPTSGTKLIARIPLEIEEEELNA